MIKRIAMLAGSAVTLFASPALALEVQGYVLHVYSVECEGRCDIEYVEFNFSDPIQNGVLHSWGPFFTRPELQRAGLSYLFQGLGMTMDIMVRNGARASSASHRIVRAPEDERIVGASPQFAFPDRDGRLTLLTVNYNVYTIFDE